MRMRWLLLLRMSLLIAGSMTLIRCGDEDPTSHVSSTGAVQYEVEFPDIHTIYSWQLRKWMDARWIPDFLERTLATKIRSYRLTPTQLPEFYKIRLEFFNADGCSLWNASWECQSDFSLDFRMVATAGPDLIDEVYLETRIEEFDITHIRSRLRWLVHAMFDAMVDDGLLDRIGGATPYY